GRKSGSLEAAAHFSLVAPGHWADKAFRRRRGVGRTYPQDLRDEGRIAGDPVAHDDAPARTSDANHLARHIVRARGKHGSENTHDEIEAVVSDAREIGRVAPLKAEAGQAPFASPGGAGP